MDALLYIERGLEYHLRKNWGRLLFLWSILFLALAVSSIILNFPLLLSSILEVAFIILLIFYMSNAIMKTLFLHEYKERLLNGNRPSYEALVVKEKSRIHGDDVSGLINSNYGDQIMSRLGIRRESLEHYLERRNHRNGMPDERALEEGLDLQQHVLNIYDNDEHFSTYLKSQRILRDDLVHAALLVQNISALEKEGDRFWSNLPLHKLSPLEYDVLNIEKANNIYFTTPVIRQLSPLHDDEKLKMLRDIIHNAKRHNRKNILISDLATPK